MVPHGREVTRVGFVLNFSGHGWLGGVSYFRNLFGALYDLPDRRVDPVVITRRDSAPDSLAQFQPAQTLRTRLVEVESPWWKVRRALQRYAGRDWVFERFLRDHGIALLSHSGHLGRRCPLPALSWIPDFQERHLPEFFSPVEQQARLRQLEEGCRHSTAMLLSSHAALRDLAEMQPSCAKRAHVLQFVAAVPAVDAVPARGELEQRYGFSGQYFHLPNQFWAHKNHKLVVEALRLLREQSRPVLVLATGNTEDHRQPGHFPALMQQVVAAGVQDWFRVLGVVPYRDLMGLMAASVAVLNPSLSEGWSTTVEEAKSFGKRVVLSDIPVHREQAPERAIYVDPRDAAAMARALAQAATELDPQAEADRTRSALDRLPNRRRAFARRFEEIALGLVAQAT